MLSRIAESLYWIGRHAERAEDTARILDVHYHLLLEDRHVDESAACRSLLDVMGAAGRSTVGDVDASAVTALLAYDESTTGSIVGALNAARENARGARDAISAEMWECLNATYHALPGQVHLASGHGPHTFFRFVKERTSMLAGLADATLTRDDGWRFLVLGRNLERADMTARLLAARYGEIWGRTGWVTTLRCCSAHEAFLRTHQRAVDASLVAHFLLLDRRFPRSVFFAVSQAERLLDELDPRPRGATSDDEARRVLGRARSSLEFGRAEDLLASLPPRLASLQSECAAAHDAITDRYFRHTRAVAWTA